MARKEKVVPDLRRRLKCSKIFGENIYIEGTLEEDLPEGFPMDGPHWDDWEEDEDGRNDGTGVDAASLAARSTRAFAGGEDVGADEVGDEYRRRSSKEGAEPLDTPGPLADRKKKNELSRKGRVE